MAGLEDLAQATPEQIDQMTGNEEAIVVSTGDDAGGPPLYSPEWFEEVGFEEPDPGMWESYFYEQLVDWTIEAGLEVGHNPASMGLLVEEYWDNLISNVNSNLFSQGFGMDPGAAREYYTTTGEGWSQLMAHGRRFMASKDSSLAPFEDSNFSPGGGGRGRGGPRGLTPEEIRNSYDIEQLAARADTVKKGLVLEGFADPRGVARAYVDKIVAGKGKVKIDFDTFVDTQVKETGRFKSIYRNLPPGMDPRQYMAPIYQQAQMAAPREAEARAIGAAQFGASAAQFQARLNRTDAVTGSAPYLAKLGNRMSQLRGVFRG